MAGHDFDRPYLSQDAMPLFEAKDSETASKFGRYVRAIQLANIEYSFRFDRLAETNNMKSPPSCGRIFSGYLVVRNLGKRNQYETWMPDHVFNEFYKIEAIPPNSKE